MKLNLQRGPFPCAVLLLGLASGPGCYRYQAIAPEQAGVGMNVRARLSLGAAEHAADLIADPGGAVRVLEGRLLERETAALVLLVPMAQQHFSADRLGQRLRLATGDILELESKQLDRRRTSILIGAGVLVATAVVIRQLRNSGEGLGPNAPGGDPVERIIPRGRRLHVPF